MARYLNSHACRRQIAPPVKITSWNIARRDECWRELARSEADVALHQEASAPPTDIAPPVRSRRHALVDRRTEAPALAHDFPTLLSQPAVGVAVPGDVGRHFSTTPPLHGMLAP